MALIRDDVYACPACGAKNSAALLMGYFDPGGHAVWSDGYRQDDFGAGDGFFRCHACGAPCDQSALEGEERVSEGLEVPGFLQSHRRG